MEISVAVRVIYIIPNHPHCNPWHEIRQRATEALEDLQWFYADGMELCGYGQKTFDIATDESGQIVFHQINSGLPPEAFTESKGNEFVDQCMEEARREGEDRRRVPFCDGVIEVLQLARAAAGYHRQTRGVGDRPR